MNYESMSDFEINKAVSKTLGVSVDDGPYLAYQEKNKPSVPVLQGTFPNRWVDYCNNPADAWPIIDSNSINIKYDGNGGGAFADEYGSVIIRHKNKLRAAMIVFLMMNKK